MKTRTTMLIAVVLTLLAAGCVSVPQPASPDDCLIAVMTETINKDHLEEGRDYRFVLSGAYKPVLIKAKVTLIQVSEPAVSIQGISSSVKGQFTGDSSMDKANILLPYDPGRIMIADFVFVKKYERVNAQSITSNIKLRKITPEEKAKLLDYFKSEKAYDGWLK